MPCVAIADSAVLPASAASSDDLEDPNDADDYPFSDYDIPDALDTVDDDDDMDITEDNISEDGISEDNGEGNQEPEKTRSTANAASSTKAEHVRLWLPSELPLQLRKDASVQQVADTELRLRRAQANDALAEIRRLRRIITGMFLFKRLHVDGTGGRSTTRILASYKAFQLKVSRAADRYRAAYNALSSLDPSGPWSTCLRPLLKEDIRGPGCNERRANKDISWIWLVPGVAASEQHCDVSGDEFMDGVRVEWLHARSRTRRAYEETVLLQEEMRRVLAWFEWKAAWWLQRSGLRLDTPPLLNAGLASFAAKQAGIYRSLGSKFAALWLPFLESRGIVPSWAAEYPLSPVPDDQSHREEDDDGELDDNWDDESLESDDDVKT